MDEIQKNKKLCERYFFLIPTNRWTGKVVDDYDYSYTELDAMPEGWRIAFGEKICEEILQELNKIEDEQVRFSYRRYCNWDTDEISKIIRKYEKLSERTCVKCGAPVTKISLGWISPWCDECAKEVIKCDNLINIEDYFNEEDKDDEETSI